MLVIDKPNGWVNMRVCEHQGMVLAVFTRDEHCPPHVHAGTAEWNARLKFSFWHNGVFLWDVIPLQRKPSVQVLEGLRKSLSLPAHLRKAREAWWNATQTTCLENLQWDARGREVVTPKEKRVTAQHIRAAHFDANRYRTTLEISGKAHCVEIEL